MHRFDKRISQKDTANPDSTNGVFAFFVGENNVKEALKRLIWI